ncbi:hypothetical protein ACT7CR_26875 [Bacillus paranthracis]
MNGNSVISKPNVQAVQMVSTGEIRGVLTLTLSVRFDNGRENLAWLNEKGELEPSSMEGYKKRHSSSTRERPKFYGDAETIKIYFLVHSLRRD